MIAPHELRAKIWSVMRVSSGKFLEMYDFMVFGYDASAIGKAFSPSGSAFVSLMLSLMTFGEACGLVAALFAKPKELP